MVVNEQEPTILALARLLQLNKCHFQTDTSIAETPHNFIKLIYTLISLFFSSRQTATNGYKEIYYQYSILK